MSLVRNKKVTLNYEILEKFEAGVELLGTEVKTIRSGHGSLDGAYVVVKGSEAFLLGSEIFAFQKANAPESFNPKRERKILLTKKEILIIKQETEKKGVSAVAISFFLKGKKIKLEFALARGKKKFDKRETIKKRDSEREMRRMGKR